MDIRFSKEIVIPILDIENVGAYEDDVFIGNLTHLVGEPWHTSKNLVDPPVYFETLDDAKAYVKSIRKGAHVGQT
jgi:hypothetical protein